MRRTSLFQNELLLAAVFLGAPAHAQVNCGEEYERVYHLSFKHRHVPLALDVIRFREKIRQPYMSLEESLARNSFHASFLDDIGISFKEPEYSFVTTDSITRRAAETIQDWIRRGDITEPDVIRPGGIFFDEHSMRNAIHSLNASEPSHFILPLSDFIKIREQIAGEATGLFAVGKVYGYILHDFGHVSAFLRSPRYMRARKRGARGFVGSTLEKIIEKADLGLATVEEAKISDDFKSRYLLATEWLVSYPQQAKTKLQSLLQFPPTFSWEKPNLDAATLLAILQSKEKADPKHLDAAIDGLISFHRENAAQFGGASNDLYNSLMNAGRVVESPKGRDSWPTVTFEPVMDSLTFLWKSDMAGKHPQTDLKRSLLVRAYQWALASYRLEPEDWVNGAYAFGTPAARQLEEVIEEGKFLSSPFAKPLK